MSEHQATQNAQMEGVRLALRQTTDIRTSSAEENAMILREAAAHLARDPDAVLRCQYKPLRDHMQLGEGDLLVASRGRVTAVEFKHIDVAATGKTARVRRTQHRKKVREQAMTYACWAKLRHPNDRVDGVAVTNEERVTVVQDVSRRQALAHLAERLAGVYDGGFTASLVARMQAELRRGAG